MFFVGHWIFDPSPDNVDEWFPLTGSGEAVPWWNPPAGPYWGHGHQGEGPEGGCQGNALIYSLLSLSSCCFL